MTPEEQAKALNQWLSEPPGTQPPAELDADVVESVYALQPERAPAARVSPDDILASVTAGPLASGDVAPVPTAGGSPAEVVDFPTAAGTGAAPSPRHKWWRAANRWGGVSALVATAATLLVVSLPMFTLSSPMMSRPASEPLAQPEEVEEQAEAPSVENRARPAPVAPRPLPRPAAKTDGAVASGRVGADADDARDMSFGRARSEDTPAVIPEVAARAESAPSAGAPAMDAGPPLAEPADEMDALAEKEMAELADLGYAGEEANTTGADLSSLRRQADPGPVGTAWRSAVDGTTLAAVDEAIARSDEAVRSGRYREAADLLAAHVTAPPAMGQAQAAAAAALYLRAGDASAAIGVASRGLSLSSSATVARARLELLLGDAHQRLGQVGAAEQAYRRAIEINTSR